MPIDPLLLKNYFQAVIVIKLSLHLSSYTVGALVKLCSVFTLTHLYQGILQKNAF